MRHLLAPLLLLALVACSQNVATRKSEVPGPRQDAPGEAAAHYAAKRQGSDDPHAAYARALSSMRRMPRYATQADGGVSATAEGGRELGIWQPLGPGNIGGRTRVLVIDPDNPRVMYTGGVSGGLWKTWTAGARWEPVGDELANLAINSLAMHPTNRNVLYAGTGEGYFREVVRGTALPLRGNGVFTTRDGGATWEQLASTVNDDFHFTNDIVVSVHDPRRVYAATRTGVWRSNDEGASWTRILDGTNVQGGCLDLVWRGDTDGDYLFASCGTFEQATVYRSKNAERNETWEPVLSEPNMSRTTLAIAPSDPSIVYALAASNEPGNYYQGLLAVYRSDRNGDAGSWTTQVTNKSDDYYSTLLLTNPLGATAHECTDGRNPNNYTTMGWYCNTIAVDPKDPNRVWAGGVDLFRSDDGGKSWGIASYWWAMESHWAFNHADQHAIVFHPQYDGETNQMMFTANDGGLYRSDNARAETGRGPRAVCEVNRSKVAFQPLNHNYGVTQFYHGAVFPDGRSVIAGAQDNGTIYGSLDRGPDQWMRVYGGDGAYVAIDPVDPQVVDTSYQFGRIVKSLEGPGAFQPAWIGLNDQFLFITPFLIDPNNHRRLWIGGRQMWRTSNATQSWTRASAQLAGQISAIAVAPGSGEVVLAGTNAGTIARTDRGTTSVATTVWPEAKPRAGFVSSLNFDPVDGNVAYATYAGFGGIHVWKSVDSGVTWSPIDGNLPDIPVHSLAVDPTRRDRLFLGTDLGVFVSTNGGATWQVENTGFAAVVTEWVTIGRGSRGPAIYAFTHGRGAWRAELTPTGPRRRGVRP